MAIKMRINTDKQSVCEECKTKWSCTPEMYDVLITNKKITLCKKCSDVVFQKLLKISCMYNSRLKSNSDMERIRAYDKINNPIKGVQDEKHPNCFAEFVKKRKCKDCKFLVECRDAYEDKQWEGVE